jgi:hypothetical protein
MTSTINKGVLCGNRAAHGRDRVYHEDRDAVRACFTGASPAQPAPSQPALRKQASAVLDNLRRHAAEGGWDRAKQARQAVPQRGQHEQPRNADEARTASFYREAAERGTIGHEQAARYERNEARSQGRTYPAAPKSLKYLDDLISKKQYGAVTRDGAVVDLTSYAVNQIIKDRLAGHHVSQDEASEAIDELKTCPYKEEPQEQPRRASEATRTKLAALLEQVPNGGYAVELEGKTHFYVVKVVHRETGRRGVRERASDELHKMYANQQVSALEAVLAQGLEESGRMYAERLDMCRNCHRTLTDDTGNPYRVYGYGPDCGPRIMGG